jgi:hypothetical protein
VATIPCRKGIENEISLNINVHSKQRKNQTHLNQSKTSYTCFVIFSFYPFVGDYYSPDLKKADGYFDQKQWSGVTTTSE